MNLIRQSGKNLLSAALPLQMFLTRGPRRARGIALTFDDGPHPEYTPRVLDELHRHGISATFFVVGREAARYPELVRRIVAEGHALGHHSYTHGEPQYTSTRIFLDEIRQSRALLQQITGQPSNLFRPPKGKLTCAKMLGAWGLGQTIALWNVDPRDYQVRDAALLAEWSRQYRPQAGDIVLLHDNHPHCVAVIRELAGRRFETLNDWLLRPAASLASAHALGDSKP
jgi:peptidoglycan/xylan/chitin deacetylase (PgdA/CDA1 family)